MRRAPVSRYLKMRSVELKPSTASHTLESPELAELQYSQEKDIHRNLVKLWNNADLRNIRKKHSKILNEYRKTKMLNL